MAVGDIFGYDRVAHASRVLVFAPRENELLISDLWHVTRHALAKDPIVAYYSRQL